MYTGSTGFENTETSQQWAATGQTQPLLPVQQSNAPAQQSPMSGAFDDLDSNSARRPPNAFILYSQTMRNQVRQENPTLSNTEVSSLLGKKWKEVPNEIKLQYKQQAQVLQEAFKKAHPDYTYKKARRKRALNELITKNQLNYSLNPESYPMGQQFQVGYPFPMGMMPTLPLQQPLPNQQLSQIQQQITVPDQGVAPQPQGVPQLFQNVAFQPKPEQ